MAAKRQETNFLRNKGKGQWIEQYVERETAVPRKRVQYADIPIQQEQEDIRTVKNTGLTSRKPETSMEKMLNTIGDLLSNLPTSSDEEDGENKEDDEDTVLRKLSKDDEPSWVMGTIFNMIHHHMQIFQQKQMRFDELRQLGLGDAADYFHETDKKNEQAELNIPTVIKPEMDQLTAAPAQTTCGKLMEIVDIVP